MARRCGILVAAAAAALAAATEQVHLSLTGKSGEMSVSWVESGACADMDVKYGTSSGSLPHTASSPGYYWSRYDLCMHTATLTSLAANTKVYYEVGNRAFSFVNEPVRAGGKVYAVYADFGLSNDRSMDQLVAEAAAGEFDAVIHAGDIAYDLNSNLGVTGNDFMNAMEPFGAAMPFMACVGNHESDSRTFENFLVRFDAYARTAAASGSDSALWYSFNDGLVHWLTVDTELWYYGGTQAQIAAQYAWLKADLAGVDRAATPWVIAFGHKQRWMDSSNFTETEAIFQAGGVNLYVCGHQHNYQRLLPQDAGVVYAACVSADNHTYTNCDKMTTLVVGSPGCRENISTGKAPKGVAVFEGAYGYGHLTVANATHLLWQWEEMAAANADGTFSHKVGAFADYFWLIDTNHAAA